jgi:hypothetical protein
LTLLLRQFVNVFTRDSRTGSSTDSRIGLRFFIGSCMSSRVTPEPGPRQIPESAVLRSSRHRQLEVPGFRMFVTPFLYRIKIPELHTFVISRLHRFQASENREFPALEKHKNFVKLNVSRVTGFPEFPNTRPAPRPRLGKTSPWCCNSSCLWQSTDRARPNCTGVCVVDSSPASKTITTPPAHKITRMRHHEHDSKETEVLGVSREPGREGIFGSGNQATSRTNATNAGSCSPRAQLSPWAALANAS